MNELLTINYEADNPTVSARELHETLGVEKRFSAWFETNSQGFVEGEDFTSVLLGTAVQNNGGIQFREQQDYGMSVDMAKHISLMSRTKKGKECRQQLIDLEKAWNTPEQIFARALKMAEKVIAQKDKLITEMAPKAEYFDELVERNLLTNFRDTAKELNISEKDFISFLISKRFIYRDNQRKIKPYAEKNNGLFEVKEFIKGNWAGNQTLITPKGRETFRLLIKGI